MSGSPYFRYVEPHDFIPEAIMGDEGRRLYTERMIGAWRLTSETQTALHEPWNLRSSTLVFWLSVQREAFCNEVAGDGKRK